MSRKKRFCLFFTRNNGTFAGKTKSNHDEKNEFVIDGNHAERCCLRW